MSWVFDERFDRKLHEFACDFWGDEVESPIEFMFLTAFHLANDHHPAGLQWEITPQSDMHCGGGIVHRVDFELLAAGRPEVQVIVECDGRDFHHANWEQLQRDRERDRQIEKAHKCKVFRFPGTQLFNDPISCAEAVISYAVEYQVAAYRRRRARREQRAKRDDAA